MIRVTDCSEFASLDWARLEDILRNKVIIDSRILDGASLEETGFVYIGVGK